MRLFFLLPILFIISCNNSSYNETTDNKDCLKAGCKNLTIKEFSEKIKNITDTVFFSCFNETFPYEYKKIKLNDDFFILDEDSVVFDKKNENLYYSFFHCYHKSTGSCAYTIFLCIDSLKTIKYFTLINYKTNIKEELFFTDSLLPDKILGL